jgi:uncharacterized OB-fold protein
MSNTGQMIIQRCKNCGALYIPPKSLCIKCDHESLEEYPVSGSGKVYTFTTINIPPETFKDEAPYDIGLVELSEGPRLTARVKKTSGGPLKIGDAVRFLKKDEVGYWFTA